MGCSRIRSVRSSGALPPGLTLMTAAVVVGALTACRAGAPTPGGEFMAMAVNADPEASGPAAVLFAGNAERQGFVVPAGDWFLLTHEPGREVQRSSAPVPSDGATPLDLTAASELPPVSSEEQAQAMEALSRFLITYQGAYLLALDTLSDGFVLPLLDPQAAPSSDDAERLRNLLYQLDAESDPAVAAVDILGAEAITAAPQAAFAVPSLFDWLKDKIKDVVGGKDRAIKARNDVILALERMTAQQRQAAFEATRGQTGFGADAPDAETFFDNLANGQYDNEAAQMRNYLQNHEEFFQFFDKRNIETAREEGAALVVAGAQFYADAIKKVLDTVFPGIGKGWELVEKLEEKLQQVKDPGKFVIRSVINQYLDEHGYELNDEEVDQMVEAISGAVARVRASAGPSSQASPTVQPPAAGEFGVFDAGYFGIIVGKRGEVEKIYTCSLHGGGLCEGENAEKQLGSVPMVLGPFLTQEEATQAYCDNIVPGTYYVQPLGIGPAATMAYDGQEHPVDNAPACP